MRFSKSPRAGRAFTLVEIMIVVAIIALLAAIAVPSLLSARERTRRTRMAEALRVARDAFEIYATEHAGFPPDAAPGVIPQGMATYFSGKLDWTAPTPLGGNWDWDYNYQPGITACISITNANATDNDMREVDAIIDDGNLATGAFRSPRPGTYSYILE